MLCQGDTMLFVRMMPSSPKLKRSEIEEKLNESSFTNLGFHHCSLTKAQKITLNHLMRRPRLISMLEINCCSIDLESLVKFLSSECCSNIRKVSISPSSAMSVLGDV